MEDKFKIAIVGPESSGKTDLSKSLADLYGENWVTEAAREYLERRDGKYQISDLIPIAKLQVAKEKQALKRSDKLLFCDTNLLVILIWSEWKFNSIDPQIVELWKPGDYKLHLLCYPDLPYQDDPLRENPEPEERMQIFEHYRNYLRKHKIPYEIIKGVGEHRLINAQKALKSHISS